MTKARDDRDINITLGAGEFYIDRYVNGEPVGAEVYAGDTVGGSITIATETTDIQSGDGQVAQVVKTITRAVSRTVSFTAHDMTDENWSLFLIAQDPEAKTIEAVDSDGVLGPTGYTVLGPIVLDRWYSIGMSPDLPSGIGEFTKATADPVKQGDSKGGSITTNVAANAYELDERAGRILFKGAGVKGKFVTVSGQVDEKTVMVTKATEETKQIECALRYIEDAGEGGRNIYVRKATLSPGGEMAMKSRDTEQQMPFSASVQKPKAPWGFIYVDDLLLTPEIA